MIDNSKEYILCSAIKILNQKDLGGEDLIYCGYRHHSILWQQHKGHLFNKKENVQGFLTSYGRFVEREEAASIAIEAGQCLREKMTNHKMLFSEDLYTKNGE